MRRTDRSVRPAPMRRLAVLLSGTGRTLEYLIEACRSGQIPAEIVQIISSRQGVRGIEIARAAGVPVAVVRRRDHDSEAAFSDAVFHLLDSAAPDLVVLAGYLCKLVVRPDYDGRLINIHPSLLPLFGGRGLYGDRVHQAVLDSGMKISGCTVHFVDNDYDAGPILLQACVPVLEDDDVRSLAARVFAAERQLYPEAIRLLAEGRVLIEGRHTRILPQR